MNYAIITSMLNSSDKSRLYHRRVEEFKKCDDGLEYPSHVSYKNYDKFSLSKENQVLVGSWDLVVKDIKIGVNYPKSYFSNIEFAPKSPVYVIENKKRAEKGDGDNLDEKMGREPISTPSRSRAEPGSEG